MLLEVNRNFNNFTKHVWKTSQLVTPERPCSPCVAASSLFATSPEMSLSLKSGLWWSLHGCCIQPLEQNSCCAVPSPSPGSFRSIAAVGKSFHRNGEKQGNWLRELWRRRDATFWCFLRLRNLLFDINNPAYSYEADTDFICCFLRRPQRSQL